MLDLFLLEFDVFYKASSKYDFDMLDEVLDDFLEASPSNGDVKDSIFELLFIDR